MRYLFLSLVLFNISLAQKSGQEIYQNLCTVCHQADAMGSIVEGGLFSGDNFHETRVELEGVGVSAGFPPLANNIINTYKLEGGREYLLNVLLYGLVGKITIDKQIYDGIMPSWANLSDQELSNVLNFVLSNWSEYEIKEIEATEFANLRQETQNSEYNCQARAKLGLNCELNSEP